jgi:hypothetical protein
MVPSVGRGSVIPVLLIAYKDRDFSHAIEIANAIAFAIAVISLFDKRRIKTFFYSLIVGDGYNSKLFCRFACNFNIECDEASGSFIVFGFFLFYGVCAKPESHRLPAGVYV